MEELEIVGGRVLLDGGLCDATVVVRDGIIADIGPAAGTARFAGRRQRIDAAGMLVAPGLVDLHGDAFERQIMPRPGVRFPLALALADTDRQLVANGITTAFHAVTYSWEPGLRSRATMVGLLDALAGDASGRGCDTRLHVRFEIDNVDAVDELCAWLAEGRIDLFAFNDHTGEMRRRAESDAEELLTYTQRTGLSAAAFRSLLDDVWSRRPQVESAVRRLARAAREASVPMLSHDDPSPEVREHYFRLGASIAEFPKTEATARVARALGNAVAMGSPNVVRGGSHLKAAGAAEMVGKRLCTVLTSDYYYPALLQAPFRLVRDGVCDLSAAWALVAAGPARAAGLRDRGMLAPGKRADIVVVDDSAADAPRLFATIAGGDIVYRNDRAVSSGRRLRDDEPARAAI